MRKKLLFPTAALLASLAAAGCSAVDSIGYDGAVSRLDEPVRIYNKPYGPTEYVGRSAITLRPGPNPDFLETRSEFTQECAPFENALKCTVKLNKATISDGRRSQDLKIKYSVEILADPYDGGRSASLTAADGMPDALRRDVAAYVEQLAQTAVLKFPRGGITTGDVVTALKGEYFRIGDSATTGGLSYAVVGATSFNNRNGVLFTVDYKAAVHPNPTGPNPAGPTAPGPTAVEARGYMIVDAANGALLAYRATGESGKAADMLFEFDVRAK